MSKDNNATNEKKVNKSYKRNLVKNPCEKNY